MNIFKNLAVMSIAAIMLIACGGDNGSSASGDEIDSSSSGVIQSSSSDVKYSSSSVKSSSSSSVILSSSSEGSSSSAKSSSSVASSSSAKSSSSTAKSSSSSDVILSSGDIESSGTSSPYEFLSSSEEESSSSVVKSSSSAKESSSSSEARSSSSSVKESSSSVKVSSSSGAKSSSSSSVILSSSSEGSSSSAKSSSSVASSSSAKSSSSTAKSSSSSVKISSSSEYVPFDHSKFLESSKYNGGAYKQFTDERNGRSYYYITITGKDTSGKANTVTVMAENLNIGEMVRGRTNQEDDSKIERYCYDNDTTNCDKYGGLYQWAEMMALPSECNTKSCADLIKEKHQGICPTGWRLQTYNDMYTIVNADGNNHDIKGVRSEYRFSGYNTTGYSLVGAGCLFNNRFIDINNGASWYYVSESTSFPDVKALASGTTTSGTGLPIFHYAKTQGFSVRCVMVE